MLHKVVISELFGQIDMELKLDSDSKITIFTAANGYGKTTLLQLISAFYCGNLAYICQIEFNQIKFYLASYDNNEKLLQHSICFSKIESSQLSYTICNEQTGQISDPLLFDLNDFSHELPPQEVIDICQNLTLEADTHIDIWGNDEYAQTCHTATVNQHPEAVNWHQQLYPDALKELLGPVNAQLIDDKRLDFELNTNQQTHPRQNTYTEQEALTLVEQCAADLAYLFENKTNQYFATCEKLNNTFAKRLIDSNTDVSQLDTESWLNQYKTLAKQIEKIVAFGLLNTQDIDLIEPQDIRKDDLRLLGLFVQDSKIKFSGYQKIMHKVQLFTAMVNHNLTFKAIKIDVNSGFEVYDDAQQHLELTTLSDGEQQLVVLLYQIIMLTDDNQLVLIDTPETGLSSQWQLNIKEQLQQLTDIYTGQFIIATHSANLINDEKALQTKRCAHCGQLH